MNEIFTYKPMPLSQLLPYKVTEKRRKNELQASLNQYKLLLNGVELSITAMRDGCYDDFDALVGENACQIRAVKIARMAESILPTLDDLANQVARAKEAFSKCKLMPKELREGLSFQDLLAKPGMMDVELTADQSFMVMAYLLTVQKKEGPALPETPLRKNDSSNPSALVNLGEGINPRFARNLVEKRLRRYLARESVNFVKEQAVLSNDASLMEMCSDRFTYKAQTCRTLPMYWTYKTLLWTAQESKIPFAFTAKFLASDEENRCVGRSRIYFRVDAEGTYVTFTPSEEDKKKPIICVEGILTTINACMPSEQQWKESMTKRKLEVILAGAADHRQYPVQEAEDSLKDVVDESYIQYKKLALEEGFAEKNPTTFFIQHVFATSIKKLETRGM